MGVGEGKGVQVLVAVGRGVIDGPAVGVTVAAGVTEGVGVLDGVGVTEGVGVSDGVGVVAALARSQSQRSLYVLPSRPM